jgi:hypothetical protein
MHTTRRFLVALLSIIIGIALPMTLKPSAAVLAVLWSLIAVALAGMVLTWEPVARRLPYRVVRSVNPHALSTETAKADAALADECERLATDIGDWLWDQDYEYGSHALTEMPSEFSVKFDGRLFRCLEGLVERRYITRDDMRRLATENYYLSRAEHRAKVMREWSHRLRRR